MIKFKPYQQCSYLYKEDSAVYVSRFSQHFPNLTPGIQEVKGQPVYLPDGVVLMGYTQLQ